jgi:hypothetical protein
VLPARLASPEVEGVDVAMLAALEPRDVRADDDQALRDERIPVELGRWPVEPGVVGPDHLAAPPLESVEDAGARAGVQDLAHDRGRDEESPAGVELPERWDLAGAGRAGRQT